jgi:hypothetical protein
MRKSLKYVLVLIPLLFFSGCFNNFASKKAEMILTITPSITRIHTTQTLRFTLKETNGVGVNLNRIEYRMWDKWGNLWWERVDTGTEAKARYQELFGTAYLAGNNTLIATFWDYLEGGPEGKREHIMSGKDDNGNSVKAGAEYWARP